MKKLPTVKSLQAEYAQPLSEKKVMYAVYQQAKNEMCSIQTAKANVDRILEVDVPAGAEMSVFRIWRAICRFSNFILTSG